jgi:poly(A) polymerase
MEILAKKNTRDKQLVIDMSFSKNMPQAITGKLGSYQLGMRLKSADFDVLCIAPRNIERADYFTWSFKLLKKQPEVKDRRAVEKTFVPVTKMIFDVIKIDLLFAWLAFEEIPENFHFHVKIVIDLVWSK